jgi:hypothetical protein
VTSVRRLYACSTRDYIRQHGHAGARAYLRMAARGIEYIKTWGPKVLPDPARQLRSLGSLYVCDSDGVGGLEDEYRYGGVTSFARCSPPSLRPSCTWATLPRSRLHVTRRSARRLSGGCTGAPAERPGQLLTAF